MVNGKMNHGSEKGTLIPAKNGFEYDLISTELDRYHSLLNILKGYEEFVLNPEGTIISSNLEAVTITGYEEWEVIGKHISIFYSQIDQLQKKPESDLAKAELIGQFKSNSIKVKKRESPFWAKMKITAIKESNLLKGFKVIIQDSTHRALSNLNVKNVRDEYLHLFNNSFIGIFKFKVDNYKLMMINDRALKIANRSNREFKMIELFYDPKDFKSLMKRLSSEKRLEGFEFRIRNEDGAEKWGSISCRLFPIGGFIEGTLNDITEKRMQIAELQRLNSELDSFIYHASHDLRAPLTTMAGLVNLINKDASIGNIQEYGKLLAERVSHLDNLLRDLVAIAYNNQAELSTEEIKIQEIVKSVTKEFENQFPHVKVTFKSDSDIIYSDSVRIRTILRNILSNALKYHNPESKNPTVSILVMNANKGTIIQVSDNGIGIKDEYKKEIFQLFFRADSRGKGSGLGLYIVKSMIDKLGGSISLDSTVGEGTTFSVHLPKKLAGKILVDQ